MGLWMQEWEQSDRMDCGLFKNSFFMEVRQIFSIELQGFHSCKSKVQLSKVLKYS